MSTTPGDVTAAVGEIGRAVRSWLATLDEGRRATATFRFADEERSVWQYTPGPRAGLAIGEMDAAQGEAAGAIVAAALSARGAGEVASIIVLEPILGELERAAGRSGSERRDPELYWFAVFGDPASADSPWSWRIGGHHVAIQQTFVGGALAGSAPSFLGANPAVVPDEPAAVAAGGRAGSRALSGEETLARSLLATLTDEQRRIAVVDPVAPPDILSGNGRRAVLDGIATGIRHDELEPPQRTALIALVRHYLDRARPELAAEEWGRIVDAGLDGLTFAWAGSDRPGQGHYYAIRGPRTLIEYDNTQDGANHIHAVWRDPTNDWGEDRARRPLPGGASRDGLDRMERLSFERRRAYSSALDSAASMAAARSAPVAPRGSLPFGQ